VRKKRKKITQAKKQKYAADASGPCARKCNDRIDSIFHATQALALRAFEWKPGFSLQAVSVNVIIAYRCNSQLHYIASLPSVTATFTSPDSPFPRVHTGPEKSKNLSLDCSGHEKSLKLDRGAE